MKSSNGFSLIELVAVMAIISIMLFLTLPRFNIFSQTDDIRGISRWIIATVPQLKSKAISEQKAYILVADLDKNAFRIASGDMPEDEKIEKSQANEYQLSDNIDISDILFPDKGAVLSGQADIHFYAKGYSDRVIIHIRDEDNNRVSFLIEPFLSRVESYDGHVDFNQILQLPPS